MVYKRLPDNLPDILRKNGLKVVEVPGWKTRGRPLSAGDFDPVGVLNHHTATGTNWTDEKVIALLVKGRPDLPGPLVQFGLSRDGVVHVVASGRCNHAGVAKASGTVSKGDGNKLYIGIEVFNDGVNEAYPKVQHDAQVLLNAVLSNEVTKNSVQTVRGHKETSVSGKPDPKFNMDVFRAEVSKKMKDLKKVTIVVKEDVVASKPGPRIVHSGKIGEAKEYKIPLGKEVAVDKEKWYTLVTFHIPKGGRYLFTTQIRKHADTTTKGGTQLVRQNWPGLAPKDSTGHNSFQPAFKIDGEWFRWETFNHVISGGGDVTVEVAFLKASSKVRAVCKVERIS